MLDWIENIKTYLLEQPNIVKEFGKRIYIQSVLNEDSQDLICIVLREFNRNEFISTKPQINSRLQIQVNHKSDFDCYKAGKVLYNLLSEKYKVVLGGRLFLKIRPIDSPTPLGKRGGSYQYTINFEIIT
jgi:hypothetical protein